LIQTAFRQLEKQRVQAPSTPAEPSRLPGQSTKQGRSMNIEERIGTWNEIGITDRHAHARKAPPPPSIDPFSITTFAATEMYPKSEESEEWAEWAVTRAKMRKNAQSRSASLLLEHVPHDDSRIVRKGSERSENSNERNSVKNARSYM
jgi:hypothetical protein